MTDACACCGKPTDRVEEHHVNHRKGDNVPDNLSPRDRRCHMEHHANERAAKFPHGPPGANRAGPASATRSGPP